MRIPRRSFTGLVGLLAISVSAPVETLSAQASARIRSPNRSVMGDWWCLQGTEFREADGYTGCVLASDARFFLGPRTSRKDSWRGVGGFWCKAGAAVAVFGTGHLARCHTATSVLSLQRVDGSLVNVDADTFVKFDPDGFYLL